MRNWKENQTLQTQLQAFERVAWGANSLGLCVSWAQMLYNNCEGNGAEHRKSARFAFEPRDTYTIVLHLQIWYEGMNALADVEFNICQLPLADAFRI